MAQFERKTHRARKHLIAAGRLYPNAWKQAEQFRTDWHTVLSGRRKRDDGSEIPAAERTRELRWMPPIPVAVEEMEDLPSTIRPVK